MVKKFVLSTLVIGFFLAVFQQVNLSAQSNNENKIELRIKQYCAKLEKACQDEQDINAVRIKTIEILKRLSQTANESIPYLVTEFSNVNKDWKYRFLILLQLASTKDRRAIKPAIRALDDKKNEIRDSCATFLGQVKSAEAVEPLILALNDKNRHVRVSACISLGEIGDPKAVKPILEKFTKEGDFVARTDFIS